MSADNLEALFRAWVSEHGGAAVKVARAYSRTPEDCQDLAQEILLQVWRSLPRFQGRASATTWFYRVALNTALSWRRSECRRQTGQLPLIAVEVLSVSGDDGAQLAQQRETAARGCFSAARYSLPRVLRWLGERHGPH